ncbi:hypothetical protein D3C77_541450 [compost metagenome]
MQVEPAQARGLVVAHGSELQPAHERRIEHHAGDDRHHEQQPHERQQQLAGQPGEHVHMQAQHGHHEAAIGRRHFHRFAAACIEHERVRRIRFGACGGGHDCDHAVAVVLIPAEVLHHLARAMGLGLEHQFLQIELGCVGRHLLELGGIAQQVVDLVMKDQRQAGDCQHQQEQGADQAGPGVNEGPATDGSAFHPRP